MSLYIYVTDFFRVVWRLPALVGASCVFLLYSCNILSISGGCQLALSPGAQCCAVSDALPERSLLAWHIKVTVLLACGSSWEAQPGQPCWEKEKNKKKNLHATFLARCFCGNRVMVKLLCAPSLYNDGRHLCVLIEKVPSLEKVSENFNIIISPF